MHKQLQANSRFLMGLYPREVIPLFQLPDSLGLLIMVVRYVHPAHTPPHIPYIQRNQNYITDFTGGQLRAEGFGYQKLRAPARSKTTLEPSSDIHILCRPAPLQE